MKKFLIIFLLVAGNLTHSKDFLKDSLVQKLAKATEIDTSITILNELIQIKSSVQEFEKWVEIARPMVVASKNDSLKLLFLKNEGSMRLNYLQYEEGMQILLELKKKAERSFDSLNLSWLNYRIGTHYFYLNEKELSLKYIEESIATLPAEADLITRAHITMGLGSIYAEIGLPKEGIIHQKKALAIKRSIRAWDQIPMSLSNLAETYLMLGDTLKAIEMVDRSLFLSDSLNEADDFAYANFLKGEFLQYQRQFEQSLPYLEKSISWWEEEKSTKDLLRAYARILISYKVLDKKTETIDILEKTLNLTDQRYNERSIEAAKNLEAKYNTEKKEMQLVKEKEQRKWAQLEEQKNRTIFIFVSIFLCLSLIYFYIRFKNQKSDKRTILKQKNLIEVRSTEIQDSILYARRLQTALMPALESINMKFSEAFVLYEPKDVVAGDFFWMDQVGEEHYFAVADCTGHGVPGALVSVVCINALNRIVSGKVSNNTNGILDETRKVVIQQFGKSGENVKDGMDISFCRINHNKLQFSGANNPLWLIRKMSELRITQKEAPNILILNDYALIEYKGDKQSIGFSDQPRPFSAVDIDVMPGDQFYMFTDGYADQFGGINQGIENQRGKKFKYSRFKKVLLENCEASFELQKNILKKTFDDWKGDLEQVDDVCVIGFKIK